MIVEAPAFDQPTLDRFYRDVLQPSFPPVELISLEAVRNAYLGAHAQPAALLIADGEPIAGILAETYPASGVLLIAYLAVHRAHRSSGHGARLLAATLPKWRAALRPSLVLAEIDDPRYHAADADTGDPWARLRWWDRAGSRLLAMPYFQPSLGAGSPRARDMLLISCGPADPAGLADPADPAGEEVSGAVVAAFLNEYFEGAEGASALTDPELLALLDWTRRRAGRVPLWPLERFPEIPRLARDAGAGGGGG
jgi:hypothetical protein